MKHTEEINQKDARIEKTAIRDKDMWFYYLEKINEGYRHSEAVAAIMKKFYLGSKHTVYRIVSEQREQHKQNIQSQNGGI